MATTTSHNKKSSAVKRILSEARELKEPTSEFHAAPLEDNIFEWHFTLRGPSGTEFEHGSYHGRIVLPAEYPFRPPDVMILTPNGRWELNKKICLTFTGFHEEMWQPAWGIRTALIGVQAFMAARAEAAVGIGSLDYPLEEREKLANRSGDWKCPICEKSNREILPEGDSVRSHEELPYGLSVDLSAGRPRESDANHASVSTSDNRELPLSSEAPDSQPAAVTQCTADDDAPLPDNTRTSSERTTPSVLNPIRTETLHDSVAGTTAQHHTALTGRERESYHGVHHHRAPIVIPRREEVESLRRLAALDRAIATVILLLFALFVRRFLNAWA